MGKAKLNIPMCAALVLLLMTMISIHLTSGLYARYTTTATGSDSARVAKWDVKGSSNNTALSIQNLPGNDSGTYSFTVTNDSEVATEYTVEFVFQTDVSEWMLLTLDKTEDNNGTAGVFSSDDKKICAFPGKYTLAPGSNATHTVLMGANWSALTKNADGGPAVETTLAFTVKIHAQQID